MRAVSGTCTQREGASINIVINEEFQNHYNIAHKTFKHDNIEDLMRQCNEDVLAVFKSLANTQYVSLSETSCNEYLKKLASAGGLIYKRFFQQKNGGDESGPRAFLRKRVQRIEQIGEVPAPTFVWSQTSFPWEVLYEGDDDTVPERDKFWGLAYSPARMLDPDSDVLEQTLPSDMLFCLHHKLRNAHENEWPEIERLVKVNDKDSFNLLKSLGDLAKVQDGKMLLSYLDKSNHNMLHFACHCKPRSIERMHAMSKATDSDTLVVSLLNTDINVNLSIEIELGVNYLMNIERRFARSPLVFLNACHTAGGGGMRVFNLPKLFVERGAAAVIATACPVPDLFAAEFAKVFYKYFLHGYEQQDEQTGKTYTRSMTIGEALRATRWYFLKKHNNPLGLVYGLYTPAFYQLAQPLTGGMLHG